MSNYREFEGGVEISVEGFDWEEMDIVNSIMGLLVEMMQQLTRLENEYRKKYRDVCTADADENQLTDSHNAILTEYREKYRSIIEPVCTPAMMERPWGMHCSVPPAYSYIKTGCHFTFTKKSDDKVRAVIRFPRGTVTIHRFEMINTNGQWQIDRSYCMTEGMKRWYTMHL